MVPSISPGYHTENDISGGSVAGFRHGDFVVMKMDVMADEKAYVKGMLVYESGWYVCHDDNRFDGCAPKNKHGYSFGWSFGNLRYSIESGKIKMCEASIEGSDNKEEPREIPKKIDDIVGYFLNRSLTK